MPNVLTTASLVEAIERGKGAKFASFTYRAKGTGELAKVTLILGADTANAYEKDIEQLQATVEMLKDANDPVALKAAQELLVSLQTSLKVGIGNNPLYTHQETYVLPVGLPGIKVHKEEGTVYVMGMVQNKTVIEAGEYKVVKSSAKTIAKNEIRKSLRSGKIRQYILPNVVRASLNGEVLELEVAQ